MKITNALGIPQPYVQLVEWQRMGHRKADISVTELIDPPQKLQLERLHDHEITVDVVDLLWALRGQMIHEILRRAPVDNVLKEEYLIGDCRGWKWSGTCDLYQPDGGGILSDWKETSAWAVTYKSRDEEWAEQLNLYALLMEDIGGLPVARIQTVPMLRDWSIDKAMKSVEAGESDTYPMVPIGPYPLPLWPMEQRVIYLDHRMEIHQRARLHNTAPPCSPAEQWRQADRWAVIKEGAQRATKVFDVRDEARERLAAILASGKKGAGQYKIDPRPGGPIRCMRYCNVGRLTDFCPQWREERAPWMPQTIRLNRLPVITL